eukprot:jgi/Astpho2/9503/Aster-01754
MAALWPGRGATTHRAGNLGDFVQQHRDGQLNSVPRPKSRAASLEQDCVRCIPLNPMHPARRSRKASWGCAAAQNWQPDFEESPLTGGLSSNLEQAVPAEQRPVNELAALREAALYSWARLELPAYSKRLALLFLGIFIMFAGPIAFQTFDPMQQPAEFLLSGTLGALVVVAAAVVRIFLGWQYVGNRLLSASVEYEETGWYDGQLFVKPPEVLARDRLLGNYEVGLSCAVIGL